ncbi:hypothetical protein K2173_022552 [Erythroxylum novogranatense]|uniref:Uncharacterized protein n=1 Tax=Erythroxylum novogranatense TaxID=1862640 RepID=A0AAV8TJT5_9ROSI|nr:hypothetical protein K2173_022552 [Erythroxylum novogranatense]
MCLRFMYLALGVLVTTYLQMTCWMVIRERQAARIRRLYLKTMLRQEIGFFNKEINTGEIVGRTSVGKFLHQIATFIAGFVIAFTRGWKLTLVMLSSLPLLILSGAVVALIISKLASRGQTVYSFTSTVVASFTGEKQVADSYNSSLIKAYKSGVNEGLVAGLGFGVVLLLSTPPMAWLYGLVPKWFLMKDIKEGMSLGQASPCLSAFAARQAATFKMFKTIDRKPHIDVYETSELILDEIQGAIELKDIYFSYPARPQERIFNGFYLSSLNGTTAALVGESGSGKLTVISLTERFYDPQDGEVLLKLFRQKISLVSQELVLFNCSIKDNVAYGFTTYVITEDDAHSLLSRSLLENVIVAHRLSTIRNADTIVVLHHGKIVQKDSHSDLTKDPEGAYSQLIKLKEIISTSKSNVNIGEDKVEITVDSARQSSQRFSLLLSLSRESSGIGNSSRHLFSPPFGVPTGIEPPEIAPEKPHTLSSASLKQSAEIPLYRLAYFNKLEIPVLLLGTASTVSCAMLLPAFGIVISRMIKTLFEPPNNLRKDARIWALVFFGIGFLISMLMNPLTSYFFAVAGCKLINQILSMCFEKVVCMEVSWFDDIEFSGGAIGARLSVDATSVRSLVRDTLGLLVQNMATAAAGMVIAFEANWELSLIVVILLPLLGVNSYKMYEEASQIANDAVGNIRTVASFCAEEKVELYEKKCEGPLRKGMREGLIGGVSYGISYVARTRQNEVVEGLGTTIKNLKGEIEFLHVSFRYPTRPGVEIFRDLNLYIQHGKRFYDPDSGTITLDGIDIKKLQLKWIRQQMGLVSQEAVLFNGTLRENIAYGKEGQATEAEILAAAELANAHNFTSGKQQGYEYDTIVGERGVQLSGGQKQRVAIARAIVKNPKVLLLDEASNALDAESERIVQEAWERIMVNRSIVVVANRLSTLRNADLIAVVKNGVIAEKGNHDALININQGIYATLEALHNHNKLNNDES